MPFPKTTRSKYFLYYQHDVLIGPDFNTPQKGIIIFSFILENEIYNTFDLKIFNIYNLENNADRLQGIAPLHINVRKDLLKANLLSE